MKAKSGRKMPMTVKNVLMFTAQDAEVFTTTLRIWNMQLTEWYPPHIKPIRRGVYLTMVKPNAVHDRGFWFQYWTGTYWQIRSDTITGSYALKAYRSGYQDVYWKGIEK